MGNVPSKIYLVENGPIALQPTRKVTERLLDISRQPPAAHALELGPYRGRRREIAIT